MTVMTPAARQIVFINTAHAITHYSLLILPTAVLAMAIPEGPFGESYGPILALATSCRSPMPASAGTVHSTAGATPNNHGCTSSTAIQAITARTGVSQPIS